MKVSFLPLLLPSALSFSTNPSNQNTKSRSTFIHETLSFLAAPLLVSTPSNALVQGNAPPPPRKKKEDRKCTNVEECQEQAERQAQKEIEDMRQNATPLSTTLKGTKYRDMNDGDDGSRVVQDNDKVVIKYKVLKAGKRSYDGISGEGTVVFSRGYGLEDDETPKSNTFSFQVSNPQIINALNDGILGMRTNGIRRIGILPQNGWRLPGKACDGGPSGSGAGGELKTDYVVVPTATMVAQESCFDSKKLPFPGNYAEQRRMAQRFDQSLIMEVELLAIQ